MTFGQVFKPAKYGSIIITYTHAQQFQFSMQNSFQP